MVCAKPQLEVVPSSALGRAAPRLLGDTFTKLGLSCRCDGTRLPPRVTLERRRPRRPASSHVPPASGRSFRDRVITVLLIAGRYFSKQLLCCKDTHIDRVAFLRPGALGTPLRNSVRSHGAWECLRWWTEKTI